MRGPMSPLKAAVDLGAGLLPRLPSTSYRHVEGDGWTAELVTARDAGDAHLAASPGALVYFHGGAFVFCGLATHRRIVERLAERTGLPVLSVAYRQLPGHRVETSVADCVGALDWLVDEGVAPETIVLAGDSAGGHLAFAVGLEATSRGIDLAGIVGLSPWLDFDNAARRRHRNAWRDDFIPTFRLDRVARLVTGLPVLDPEHSPVNRDLAALPPVLMICGHDEVLRHDAELMTERLEAAGVPVHLHLWQGQVHAFPVLGNLLPESAAALDQVASFVGRALGVRRLRAVS
jgi:acetyl esterase/lipase